MTLTLLFLVATALQILLAYGDQRYLGQCAQAPHAAPGHWQRVELGHIQQALCRSHDDEPYASFEEDFAKLGSTRQIESQHIASSAESVGRHLVGADHRYSVGFGELLVKVAELQIVAYICGNLSDVVAAVLGCLGAVAVPGREPVLA